MPRYEFDGQELRDDWVDSSSRLLGLVVRSTGLVLLAVGFVVALMVIASAWSLYEEPSRIEAFAREVEHGSNLDLTLAGSVAAGRAELEGTRPDGATVATRNGEPAPAFRFSYFIAWAIAILLLLLIGRLAIAAVRTGGELALYDVKVGKLARALLRERQRAQ
ncbi:MAG: hypothetical protein RLW61_03885 [Gammaproteobacteria bacterium]